MMKLPLPATPDEDKAVLTKICASPAWAPHKAAWEQAYDTYRLHGGDPHSVTPTNFGQGVSDLQYKLYDGRKRTKPLAGIRRQKGLLSCPMCGSLSTGSLDHYLPREVFSEFSIMRANLIPACTHCNSHEKGNTYIGPPPARFIHPYFDAWAHRPIWQVEIVPPYVAARFRPIPTPLVVPPNRQIVVFHLDNLLGTQFELSMSNWWSTLPELIRLRIGGGPATLPIVAQAIADELHASLVTTGTNSWLSAAFRGLASDGGAVADLIARL